MSTHSSPHRSDRAVSREKTISSAAGNEFHHGSPSPAAIEPVQLEPGKTTYSFEIATYIVATYNLTMQHRDPAPTTTAHQSHLIGADDT